MKNLFIIIFTTLMFGLMTFNANASTPKHKDEITCCKKCKDCCKDKCTDCCKDGKCANKEGKSCCKSSDGKCCTNDAKENCCASDKTKCKTEDKKDCCSKGKKSKKGKSCDSK